MGALEVRRAERVEEREFPRPSRTISQVKYSVIVLVMQQGSNNNTFQSLPPSKFLCSMVEIKLRMSTVRTLGTVIKSLQRIASDIVIQCTDTGFALTCINASLTTLCHCVFSRDAFEAAIVIQDSTLLGHGYKVPCEVLLVCLSYVEASDCTLVFSPSMITFMYCMSQPQTIIAKMYYEQVKVVQALHPELQEYPLVIRTIAQPWITCLSKAVGAADEMTVEVGNGLVLLGLKGKSMQCKLGLPLIELYEVRGSLDAASVTIPFSEFKAVLSMAKTCNSLLTLHISGPGVPVLVTLPIQGIEQCKFIIATLELHQDEDGFVVDVGEVDWEYPATSSSGEEGKF